MKHGRRACVVAEILSAGAAGMITTRVAPMLMIGPEATLRTKERTCALKQLDSRHFATYYMRALEIPTPRATFVALKNDLPLPRWRSYERAVTGVVNRRFGIPLRKSSAGVGRGEGSALSG
jgi:hypothetical protein